LVDKVVENDTQWRKSKTWVNAHLLYFMNVVINFVINSLRRKKNVCLYVICL
jgi:hypothetical protein